MLSTGRYCPYFSPVFLLSVLRLHRKFQSQFTEFEKKKKKKNTGDHCNCRSLSKLSLGSIIQEYYNILSAIIQEVFVT